MFLNSFIPVGCGRTCPDPAGDYTDQDNVVIPKGKGTSTSVTNTSLLYNEYPSLSLSLSLIGTCV